MIRQSLDGDSAYVDAARHGEGSLTSLQFRDQKGAITREVESNVSGPTRLRIEKLGDRFYMWVGNKKGHLQFSGGSAHVDRSRLRSTSVLASVLTRKMPSRRRHSANVVLDTNITPAKAQYSTVETLFGIGRRTDWLCFSKAPDCAGLESRWQETDASRVGGRRKEAIFTPLRTAAPVGAPITAEVQSNGEYVASNQSGTMQIWHKGADGSQPEQMTPADYNSVSPHLSPDGKYLLFLTYAKDLSALPENQEVSRG